MSAAGALRSSLAEAAGTDAVTDREIDRLAMAHDASHYLLVPDAVVTPTSADQVARIMAAAARLDRPLTFRSGGTSLSGQALTDSILVDTRSRFRGIEILDGGERVRVEPGITVRQVNAHLARHGRRLGPDPASEIACTIGGVIANNSSGMACGTELNTYRTLESMVVVLPSGTVIDTSAHDADARLAALEPDIHAGLTHLRDRVRADPASVATIRRLFSMKNTMGYSLNAFLDFDAPAQILAHLLVGSEGTLGFVASAVFRTVPILPRAATGLLTFPSLSAATAALPQLVETGLATIELMDAASLRVAQADPGAPRWLAQLQVHEHAALLVEQQAGDDETLERTRAETASVARGLELATPFALTTEPETRAALWHLRKGLYTAVAASRPSGSNALLEDIAVPVPALLATCRSLTGLFAEHGYRDSVIFGHAKDGNIHFMLAERFDDASMLRRYRAFTDDMVDMVLEAGGVLKAEHGTGRMMAPFVERQYGAELYDVIRSVKTLIDPGALLNPGVIVAADGASYTDDLKTAPSVEAEVDRCVECGYCEPVCPSKDLTMTPRRRIVIRREIAAAEARGDTGLAGRLRQDYQYDGVDTCAVDGMCQVACPVLINTGDLVRRLRAEQSGSAQNSGWAAAAEHWDAAGRAIGTALTVAKALPAPVVTAATRVARAALGAENVPLYEAGLPGGGARRSRVARSRGASVLARSRGASVMGPASGDADAAGLGQVAPVAVYFPACIGTMFGPAEGGEGVMPALLSLCERAGVRLVIPDGIDGLCCGTPWKSKGMLDGYRSMTERVLERLWAASGNGALLVVCDASSCTEGLVTMLRLAADGGGDTRARFSSLRFVDSVDFAVEHLLDRLTVTNPIDSLALHPTCSSTQLGSVAALQTIAETISDDVVVPVEWGCCGFAGDRGLLHPELTASATAAEAAEIAARDVAEYASTNRTCELGMTGATGRPYRHVLELLERATRPNVGVRDEGE
ncbi:FAD-binding and (Fe-S)-binding domain-containing protein [Microbacterium sp. STN6]|uniref:FAD-binding and (Fe-S)-binding domain-containing protein n=1 Tax=Microbacterium sp. STN6 TaxID=2995588 RepID=UPI002260AE91|nr:FAD-binding and (Fe-S)-binding domain-containing protein [Microbacterium sp. STN6]MCX7523357.1 FAD-binding and (Fe-S)-binding domain-containing protein [Microbacterium sp. STN6]